MVRRMDVAAVSGGSFGALGNARVGFDRAEKRLNGAAHAIANGEISSSRMVDLIVSEKMYTANASVVRSVDERLGMLLRAKA